MDLLLSGPGSIQQSASLILGIGAGLLYGTQSWAFININLYGIWSKALWSPVQDFMELGLGLYRKIMPHNKTVTHHVINKIKTARQVQIIVLTFTCWHCSAMELCNPNFSVNVMIKSHLNVFDFNVVYCNNPTRLNCRMLQAL